MRRSTASDASSRRTMLKVEAHAKINLTLDVVGKRPDGYHELRTIMHEIPLCDELTLDFDAMGLS